MKLLICGGADFGNRIEEALFIRQVLGALHKEHTVHEVVVGDLLGTCVHAVNWSGDNAMPTSIYTGDWNRYGSAAAGRCNAKMLEENDDIGMVVAFPGGSDVADMVRKALIKGVKVYAPVMKGRE